MLYMCTDIKYLNNIGGVMVSMLALSSVDVGSSPSWIKPKTMKLVFSVFWISMQY
jgi:hypothetical protein